MNTILSFAKLKKEKEPISMITCYDYSFARIINQTEIDAILVGDSLGMVIAGESNTLSVTLDQIIYHTTIVRRGAPAKFIVADLPYLTYHLSISDTINNAGRIIKESGAQAIKLEGGQYFAKTVKSLVEASVPVMGHLGLTPQSIHKLGGYNVQGKQEEQRKIIIEDAKILEEAGVFALVLEMVPEDLAKEISSELSIPTIGIGAGRFCDGQVLVLNDLLGLDERFNPKFLKKYANFSNDAKKALNQYSQEVRERKFPKKINSF